ncbi:MAG: hypothetical protein LIO54_09825 [Oscillospiraceae bacterium]|nr:hypothetical protein [Oscillospiraceae bacterium]
MTLTSLLYIFSRKFQPAIFQKTLFCVVLRNRFTAKSRKWRAELFADIVPLEQTLEKTKSNQDYGGRFHIKSYQKGEISSIAQSVRMVAAHAYLAGKGSSWRSAKKYEVVPAPDREAVQK